MKRIFREWVKRMRVEPFGMAMPGARLPERIRRIGAGRTGARFSRVRAGCIAAICAAIAVALVGVTLTGAQSSGTSDWEKAAGGKMAFEVASIKRHPYDPASQVFIVHQNFPLDEGNSYAATGGRLSAENYGVGRFVAFAYKLTNTQVAHLKFPSWVRNEHFDVDARGSADATKDQMRLMMQSLLAERFKLAVHWENQETPVFSMVLVTKGKMGPQLLPDAEPTCTDAMKPDPQTGREVATRTCRQSGMKYLTNGEYQVEGERLTMQQIAATMAYWPGTTIDRPAVDGTGLTGTFNYRIVWAPDQVPPGQPPSTAQGPTFLEALHDQLGLKLVQSSATLPFLVIDHIEEPTPN